MLAAAVDVVAERVGEAEVVEVALDPARSMLDEATARDSSGGSERTNSIAPDDRAERPR